MAQENLEGTPQNTTFTRPTVTEHDLLAQGFSPDLVSDLTILRDSYNAFSDLFESDLEWKKVQLFKWECEHGGCQDFPEEKRKDNRLEHRWNPEVTPPAEKEGSEELILLDGVTVPLP